MKVALCFIINYDHILNKEDIWREWIEHNKEIINVYFYYKDLKKIKSQWILKHTIPPNFISETSYYHIIPAYLSLMRFALNHDKENQWFCMLTESCCPIISPTKFKYLFYNNYDKSIISWKPAWWNKELHTRANLIKLPQELHLANDPWFIMKRENVLQCLSFVNSHKNITTTICSGGLANESLFAIILFIYQQLDKTQNNVISCVTHVTDWKRGSSPTSPHVFTNADELDLQFIDNAIKNEQFLVFIRKVSSKFPDEIIRYYIYEKNKDEDNKLTTKEPFVFIYNRYKKKIFFISYYGLLPLFITYIVYTILF